MSFSSNFRMLISQQSSTTPVQPAELINTKMEVFFMRELRNTKIIAVDHGYGNMKTANTVTPTGIKAYETEPIFTGNILEYNGIYYRIGEGHKEKISVPICSRIQKSITDLTAKSIISVLWDAAFTRRDIRLS